MNENYYFVMYTTCRLTHGKKESLIVDYAGDVSFHISHQYEQLIQMANRHKIKETLTLLDDQESKKHFLEFVDYMVTHRMAALVEDESVFPKMSDELSYEEYKLRDIIWDVNEKTTTKIVDKVLERLFPINCKIIQIRQNTPLNTLQLDNILEGLKHTGTIYAEVHATINPKLDIPQLEDFICRNALLNNLFLYGAEKESFYSVMKKHFGYSPYCMGTIFYKDFDFDGGNVCGTICKKTLDFSGYWSYDLMKKKNGCLYKKLSIDALGNYHNCPSMQQTYGNIFDRSIDEVLQDPKFLFWWNLNKDKIKVCCDCEYRYNCSDCRAFIEDSNDPYSKPSKCKYDPYSNLWS